MLDTMPEKRLAGKMIIQALEDHQENITKYSRDLAKHMEPARWLLSDDNREYGFVWLCDALDIEPWKLRFRMHEPRLLKSMKEDLAASSLRLHEARIRETGRKWSNA